MAMISLPTGRSEQNSVGNAVAQSTSALYFEDLEPGFCLNSSPHRIDGHELVEFAKIWDPLPFHVDEQAGLTAFGSLTAPGLYMLAVKQRLIHQLPKLKIIASLGYDEVRFATPLRPTDSVVLKLECVKRRLSGSRPGQGIVTLKLSLINQHRDVVMSHLDSILVHCHDLRK